MVLGEAMRAQVAHQARSDMWSGRSVAENCERVSEAARHSDAAARAGLPSRDFDRVLREVYHEEVQRETEHMKRFDK
jgi:hypothetical protein